MWQERVEEALNTDRLNARAASAMGNTELVQIEVAEVSANCTRRGETDLGAHIGTVHVHATAVLVHKFARAVHTSGSNTP